MNPLRAALQAYRTRASWLGDGGMLEPREVAQRRADVCLACPLNQEQGLREAITKTVVEQLLLKKPLKATLDCENRLHLCQACGCVLALKVWVPLKHILVSSDTGGLPAHCWIVSEFADADTETP